MCSGLYLVDGGILLQRSDMDVLNLMFASRWPLSCHDITRTEQLTFSADRY